MGKSNGGIKIDSSAHIDIDEYLRKKGRWVQGKKVDMTGFLGGMPADTVVSSEFFRNLDKQNLASLS